MSGSLMRASLKAFAFLFVPPILAAQAVPVRPVDWAAMQGEATEVLRQYLRINTTNPPGNEMETARFLKEFLEKEGIEAQVLDTVELGKGRANLYARLKGNGSKRAIALVQHMDVVPATPASWTMPAFSGEVKDGFIYGRGALDMKGEGIAHLMALVALKRSGVPLTRDIVFIANADEEFGSTGALVFVDRHADLIRDVEYLFTEGGANVFRNGKLEYYSVGVAEKRTFWEKVTVHGIPSHGSRPTKANPVPRLVAALDKIVTVLTGSNKTNVIPGEASVELDIRLLPDQDADSMLATLTAIVADTAVHFSPILAPKAPFESPTNTDLFRAIETVAKQRDPGTFVTSSMMTGATDRPSYRKLGIIAYGLDPFKVEAADEQRGVHGNDERLAIANVGAGVTFVYDILRYAQ
jgi:acetylornithine deacetylase/succinyl-diaminopimelate desuccinylase-like protein